MSAAGQELPDDLVVGSPLYAYVQRVYLEGLLSGMITAHMTAWETLTGSAMGATRVNAVSSMARETVARTEEHLESDPIARERLREQRAAALHSVASGEPSPFSNAIELQLNVDTERIHGDGCDGSCQH